MWWQLGAAIWWLLLGVVPGLTMLAAAPGDAWAVEPDSIAIEVFVAEGCPHCASAMRWLEQVSAERPELAITVQVVTRDSVARYRLIRLARERGVAAVGVPAFLIRERLIIGWQDEATTGGELLSLLAPEAGPSVSPPAGAGPPVEVQAPLIGTLSVRRLGLPLFTIALGLIDGFNPCAMWALLLILGILVRLRDRRKMVAIAGTFVAVGGAMYFVFLGAWLEFFLLVGFSRGVQLMLGIAALAVGAVNLKDVVAFRRGPSLGIPEALKPGIYAHIRRVLAAPTLPLALLAVALLSLAVNLVELLCTAGLPAVYTQVLGTQDLSRAAYYSYLLLYVAAYVLDDSLMLALVTITLTRTRLQERAGRWLKLVSGAVMGALGLLLILKPAWVTTLN
jgi:glutaredoxin